MKIRPLLLFPALLVLCLAYQHAAAQYVVMSSSLTYASNTGEMVGFSRTEMDFKTQGWYQAYVKAEIRRQADNVLLVSGENYGAAGANASVTIRTPSSPNVTFRLDSYHWILPVSNYWCTFTRLDRYQYSSSTGVGGNFGATKTLFGYDAGPNTGSCVNGWIYLGKTTQSLVGPPPTITITNSRVSGNLAGTNQNALRGAYFDLHAAINPPSLGGGSYSWTFSGPVQVFNGVTNADVVVFRPSQTGNLTATVTYNRTGISPVTAQVNINTVLPTLTSFTAYADAEQINRGMRCSLIGPVGGGNTVTYTLGCFQGNAAQPSGIVFTAQAQIPALTYLTDPANSGIKIKQYIREYRKRVNDFENGNFQCEGYRNPQGQLVISWQVDGGEDISPVFYPPPMFSQSTVLHRGVDGPGVLLEGPDSQGNVYMFDVYYVEESFETYVEYFVSHYAAPTFTEPLRLSTENTYRFSRIQWSRNGQAIFDYAVPNTKYLLQWTNSSRGNIPVTGANSLPPFQATSSDVNQFLPCPGEPQSTNKIDGARCFISQQYWDVLGWGPPDQGGWDFYTYQIAQCQFDKNCIYGSRAPGAYHGRRTEIAYNDFFKVASFNQTDPAMANPPGSPGFNPAIYNPAFVRHCYLSFLRREPDPDGNSFWINNLNTFGDYRGVIDAFIYGPEYRSRTNFHPCQ